MVLRNKLRLEQLDVSLDDKETRDPCKVALVVLKEVDRWEKVVSHLQVGRSVKTLKKSRSKSKLGKILVPGVFFAPYSTSSVS